MLFAGNERDWPPELASILDANGYRAAAVADLSEVPILLAGGKVEALFVLVRPLGASELLVLRRLREASPRMAIVFVTTTPTDPDLKRAFESGATAFLSWPATPDTLRHAIESGAAPLARRTGEPPPPARASEVGGDAAREAIRSYRAATLGERRR